LRRFLNSLKRPTVLRHPTDAQLISLAVAPLVEYQHENGSLETPISYTSGRGSNRV
jgi:hypothetical protein